MNAYIRRIFLFKCAYTKFMTSEREYKYMWNNLFKINPSVHIIEERPHTFFFDWQQGMNIN